ncbi:MAG: hypothetical protein KDD35_09295, partial [Bdellovibrionales bacterium]|nr:hypothetical protein [Bdellovibrionales bacterium]
MNKKANLALQATTDANKTFLLSDPESLQQINCYILVVGAPNLKAYNFSSQQGNTLEFGLGRFYHSAGTTIELLVPSGASRTITLLGSVSQGTACKELPAGEAPDFQNLSRPVVIAQETRDLPPGDVEILLTANLTTKFFDTSNWFTTTPGAGGSDGNTTPSEPIVISSPTPSVAYSSVSVGQSKSFSVVANSTGALSYQWKINGNVDIALVGSGSSALFTSAASQLGDNLIEVTISNGSTTASHSWLVNVNYFSQACNELLPGNICTLSGVYDIGDNSDPFVEADRLKIAPGMMVKDETEGYFISDISNSVIWYHNRNPTTRSILGLSIPPGKIRVVAGTGISVPATAGIALEKPINVFATPADMAWDSTQQRLFFLEYASGKVWQVDSSGNLTQIFGGGASNSEGVSGVTHQCTNAKGLDFDSHSNY